MSAKQMKEIINQKVYTAKLLPKILFYLLMILIWFWSKRNKMFANNAH